MVFDVGETIVSEERIYARWADHLGVRRIDFFAVLGSIIANGAHHRDVFEYFSPGLDVDAAIDADPTLGSFDADDLYPDVVSCFEQLRALGCAVGLAGNQPERAEEALHEIGLDVDFVAASQRWGVEKPSPEFFHRIVEECGVPAGAIAYVGDRVDNDVLPARDAGMVSIFLRRGPWALIQATRGPARWAHFRIESLLEVPPIVEKVRAARGAGE